MNKIFSIGIIVVLFFALIEMIATYKKAGSNIPVNPDIESKDAIASVKMNSPIPKDTTDCSQYKPGVVNDYWIVSDTVKVYYAANYVSPIDSITVICKKDSSDCVIRKGLYIRGTLCGDRVFFKEEFINSEEKMIKYVYVGGTVRDPRQSQNWHDKLNEEGIFTSLENAIDALAALNGSFIETRNKLIDDIKKNIPIPEKTTPEQNRQILKEYTNLLDKIKLLSRA